MLITGTSDKIQFKLSNLVTTTQLPFTVDYNNYTTTAVSLVTNNGTSNDTTAVDLVPSPSSNQQNELRYCSIYNADSVSETVIIQVYDGTNTRIVFRAVLSPGDTLQYQLEKGWEVIDSTGTKRTTSIQVFNNSVNFNTFWKPSSTTGTLTFLSQQWHYAMLGRAEKAYSSIDILYNITTGGTGGITYSEIAIYSPPLKPFDGTAAIIGRRLGSTNTAAIVNSGGIKKTNIALSNINTGDFLYVVFANRFASTQPVIRSQGYADGLSAFAQGLISAGVASGQPSLVPTGPYVTGVASAVYQVFWQGN